MEDADEILDLVDIDDKVVGTIARSRVRTLFGKQKGFVRYAECFIRNKDGQLWIPRRTTTKTIAPGGLDFSASEHIQAGESYIDATIRGLKEELLLTIHPEELKDIGKLQPKTDRPFFCQIFLLERDEAPDYNRDDFTDYEWLKPDQLINRLQAGELAKLDLLDAAQLVR